MSRIVQMYRSVVIVIGICLLVAGAALGAGFASWSGHPVGASHEVSVPITQGGTAESAASANPMGFSSILKPALPAVVSITSSRMVKVPQSPFFNDPFFQQFFGGQFPRGPQQQREMGLGSGVIVSPDGYILTNNHVVEKGTDIKVILQDKRQFPGKVVRHRSQDRHCGSQNCSYRPTDRQIRRFVEAAGGRLRLRHRQPLWSG